MLQPTSPAYPLCQQLAVLADAGDIPAAERLWTTYNEERKDAGKPLMFWESLAIKDTVQGLRK